LPETPDLAAVQRALGHSFDQLDLLRQALTHPSVGGRKTLTNQRLEFQGDRVVGLIAADMLLKRFPNEDEGKIARRHAALVQGETLAEVAVEINLGAHLAMSTAEAESGGRDNRSTLADALEAVIAALYRDGGLEQARSFLLPRLEARIDRAKPPPIDPKTRLQEWVQGRGDPLPAYRIVSRDGPAHEPRFTVEVAIDGHAPHTGEGTSKRLAEKAAASALIEALGLETDD